MQDNDLVTKSVNPENDLETKYMLTDKALKLKNILYEVAKYTLESDEDSLDISPDNKKKLITEIRTIYNKSI